MTPAIKIVILWLKDRIFGSINRNLSKEFLIIDRMIGIEVPRFTSIDGGEKEIRE